MFINPTRVEFPSRINGTREKPKIERDTGYDGQLTGHYELQVARPIFTAGKKDENQFRNIGHFSKYIFLSVLLYISNFFRFRNFLLPVRISLGVYNLLSHGILLIQVRERSGIPQRLVAVVLLNFLRTLPSQDPESPPPLSQWSNSFFIEFFPFPSDMDVFMYISLITPSMHATNSLLTPVFIQ